MLSGKLAGEWALGQPWAEMDFTGVHFTQDSCDACLAALEQVQGSSPYPPITCGERTCTCACPDTCTRMVLSSDRDTASGCLTQSVFYHVLWSLSVGSGTRCALSSSEYWGW